MNNAVENGQSLNASLAGTELWGPHSESLVVG
jgi:hypothetical protein